jgi:hypothetical protein
LEAATASGGEESTAEFGCTHEGVSEVEVVTSTERPATPAIKHAFCTSARPGAERGCTSKAAVAPALDDIDGDEAVVDAAEGLAPATPAAPPVRLASIP